jgi:hypothetical protein
MPNLQSVNVDDIIDIKHDNITAFALATELLNKSEIAYNGINCAIQNFNDKISELQVNNDEFFLDNQYNHYLELLYHQIQSNINIKISTVFDISTSAILSIDNNNFNRHISLTYKRSSYLWPTITLAILDNMRLLNLQTHIVINIGNREYILTKSPTLEQFRDEIETLKVFSSNVFLNLSVIDSGKRIIDAIKEDLQI